jgi:hypothetical protein
MSGLSALSIRFRCWGCHLSIRKEEEEEEDPGLHYSEDGSRSSREELAGNKSSEQEQDPMASYHKGPVPLRGRNDILLLLLSV